jgi:hypothetical protein
MAETPQGPEAQVGEQVIGGNNSRMRSEVKAGLRIDTQQLNQLKTHLKEARDITKSWREEMEKLAKAAKNVQGTMAGAGGGGKGGGGAGTPRAAGTDGEPINSSGPVGQTASATASATGGGRFQRALGVAGTVVGTVSSVVGGGMRQLDARIDRGMQYASSADKLNLLTQQMTGMSQMQAMQQRRGLTDYRLGAGGTNAATQFGLSTGQTITPEMARSIEAIRTSTGFTKSTADILAEQRQLMDPTVANRMFFMGGVNAYNVGGGMNDPLQMRQEIVNRMGLDNQMVMRGALTPGSVTRARMADLGLGEEMQTEILQYAQQNMSFREKGGRGMYDPSKMSHRQLMGIEDNLATQQEETQRVTDVREEQFMRRQIDNMASLEKSNQDLINALASLEDTMSGVVGARISSRPKQQMVGGALKGIGSGLMLAGGAATATVAGSAAGVPMMAIGALATGIGAMLGDPADPDAEGSPAGGIPMSKKTSSAYDGQIQVPYGYNGKKISLSELKNKSDFQSLHPRFKGRLLEMMRVNPEVGVGGGSRASSSQETMFKSRYRRTDEETKIYWDGSYWEHVSGAAAAPPGRSMHEIGLAADLVGDLDWMNANADKFGLKHFAGVNNEPWHVQPSDLPNSRRKYEDQGAAWGTDGQYVTDDGARSNYKGGSDHSASGQPQGPGGTSVTGLGGMSISQAISAQSANGLTRLLSSGGTSSGSARTNGSVNLSSRGSSAPLPPPGPGALSGAEIAKLAYNAGFRGEDLAKVVAISHRESRWKPGAYNPNRATKDDSYGLMQINMLGDLGPARLEQFGISKYEDLYDPQTNMNAAYVLYQRSGNTLHPWGGYKGESNTYNTDISLGHQAIREAGLQSQMSGDPTDFMRAPTQGGGGRSVSITSSPSITVAPVINFNGAPATSDLRSIAQTVSRLIKEEVDMMKLRTS